MSENRKAYKDYFDRQAAKSLGQQIAGVSKNLDQAKFVRFCVQDLKSLEFSDRVKQFSAAMRHVLPSSVPQALSILQRSLPAPLPDCEAVTDGWLQWPVGQFVADFGAEHFDESFSLMIELTQRFSSEFAVRPFVENQPEATFARLRALVDHESPHVRRWCSEGVRPRLPWGKKLNQLINDPSPILPILEALKDDEELYVRRSVANNLNDLAKDHADLVVQICRKWSKGKTDRSWLIRHSLRSLIKQGDPRALEVVGFAIPDRICVECQVENNRVAIGDHLELTIRLTNVSESDQSLMVDYAIEYVRQNSKRSEKVFKWKTLTLSAGDSIRLCKRHSMRQTTVRRLYPGLHRAKIQVNGKRVAEAEFELQAN